MLNKLPYYIRRPHGELWHQYGSYCWHLDELSCSESPFPPCDRVYFLLRYVKRCFHDCQLVFWSQYYSYTIGLALNFDHSWQRHQGDLKEGHKKWKYSKSRSKLDKKYYYDVYLSFFFFVMAKSIRDFFLNFWNIKIYVIQILSFCFLVLLCFGAYQNEEVRMFSCVKMSKFYE